MSQSGTVGQTPIGPVGPLAQSGQSGSCSNLGSQIAFRPPVSNKTVSKSIEQSGPVVDRASRPNSPIGRVGPGCQSSQSGKCPNRASRARFSIGPVGQMAQSGKSGSLTNLDNGEGTKVSVRWSHVSSDVKARRFTPNIKARLAPTMLFSKNGLIPDRFSPRVPPG